MAINWPAQTSLKVISYSVVLIIFFEKVWHLNGVIKKYDNETYIFMKGLYRCLLKVRPIIPGDFASHTVNN